MTLEDQILDHNLDRENDGREHVKRNLASAGQRFANHIIDIIVYYILLFIFIGFIGSLGSATSALAGLEVLAIWGIRILYFWGMEAATGKTVGKFVTRTHIVKPDGSKPEPINVLGRSLSRLIPFDAFSYLGNRAIGWHDSIPKIYVIKD